MKLSLVRRAVPLLVTTILAATPVWAQTGPDASAPSGTSHKVMPHANRSASAGQSGEAMQSLVERRITDLHSRLHITPEQSQQWDQFAQLMRDNARDLDQGYHQRAENLNSMTAVDNLQSYAQLQQERAQDMQKLVPAFQTLYGALSDQQKQQADQMFRSYAANAQSRRQATATQ
jgi:hypothetical protein